MVDASIPKKDREFTLDEYTEWHARYAAENHDTLHVSLRTASKKWIVRREGSSRALRRFSSQAEALAYAVKLAGDGTRIVIHDANGMIDQVLGDRVAT